MVDHICTMFKSARQCVKCGKFHLNICPFCLGDFDGNKLVPSLPRDEAATGDKEDFP